MKRKKGKSSGLYIGLFILIALVSAAISFNIFNSRQKLDTTTEEIEETHIKTEDKSEETYDKNFLNVKDNIFIESYYGPSDIIELNEDEIQNLANIFKTHDTKYIISSDNKEISYLYAVHIKNKQVKVKLNESYLLFETPDKVLLYSVENEGLKDLIAELETVYMSKYNEQDIFHRADSIEIISNDEDLEWALNPEMIDELESQIYLISPIDKTEAAGVPRRYPDYLMNIKTSDTEYSIHLLDEDILSIDSGDSITYYKHKNTLWDYMTTMYPIEKVHSRNSFEYLLNSSKVVIDAKDDNFDIEDETFYPVEIPRYIISAEKKPLDHPMDSENLVFSITFTVNNEQLKVDIFENQIIFEGQAYYSEKIGEAIMSMLNV